MNTTEVTEEGQTSQGDIEQILQKLRALIYETAMLVEPQKRDAFQPQLREVLSQLELITKELEYVRHVDEPQQRFRSRLDITTRLTNVIEVSSKKFKESSNGGWAAINLKWHALHKAALRSKRQRALQERDDEERFQNTLRWMAENGQSEELSLLRQVKPDLPFNSTSTLHLLELAEAKIVARVYDPVKVAVEGEEAYQRHRQVWDKKYQEEFIAIHRGDIIAHSKDKAALFHELVEQQRSSGSFRAYVVKIGAPVLDVGQID